ncbi:ParB N-terminal domain-containing protein [Flammeovirga agarivorans]|uniref:ParB N-terminal domain-containing protein n=1 Tax=Flammeovirga agarivorans TaxID=2726742 RepID=A0A7X8XZ58_9BACT|nr:ParB N-terminal domain-containing protein [Flammeovirga agarivorans]NLR94849.1 ParB N-terminal domain-containing protein [Flammeovirga agarivorans]
MKSLGRLDRLNKIKEDSYEESSEKINAQKELNKQEEELMLVLGGAFPLNVEKITISTELEKYIRQQNELEYMDFFDSVKVEGVRDPIVIFEDPESGETILVDGHHRVKAAKELNIKSLLAKKLNVGSFSEVKLWMLKNQLGRRNLTDGERIFYGLEVTKSIAELAKKKKKTAFLDTSVVSANLHLSREKKIDRMQVAANYANVSRRQTFKFTKILNSGKADLIKKVMGGKVSIHKAYLEVTEENKEKKKPTKKGHEELDKITEKIYNSIKPFLKSHDPNEVLERIKDSIA